MERSSLLRSELGAWGGSTPPSSASGTKPATGVIVAKVVFGKDSKGNPMWTYTVSTSSGAITAVDFINPVLDPKDYKIVPPGAGSTAWTVTKSTTQNETNITDPSGTGLGSLSFDVICDGEDGGSCHLRVYSAGVTVMIGPIDGPKK